MSNVATQIKKGQVLNPHGRPKREWTMAGLIADAMEEQDETGVPYKKLITKRLVRLAAKGDIIAIKEINNRIDGMPKQDITSDGEKLESTTIIIAREQKDEK